LDNNDAIIAIDAVPPDMMSIGIEMPTINSIDRMRSRSSLLRV
jgi:hypothetical protein